MGILFFVLSASALSAQVPAEQIRGAAAKSIALLQKASAEFSTKQQCFTCHHHGLPMMALHVARERGVPVDEQAAQKVAAKVFGNIYGAPLAIDHAVQANFIIDPATSEGGTLIAAQYAGLRPNLASNIFIARTASHQRPDGRWATLDVRPPQSHSAFTATAIGLRAVLSGLPKQLASEKEPRTKKARAWFLANKPLSTEDYTYRLFGLKWSSAESKDVDDAAKALAALQRADGGWAQLPNRASDAYATGEVLLALHEAGGMKTADAVWQRGLQFLLKTQKPDGSWLVETRMTSPAQVSPPYFETGFPYGKNQFISSAGTSYAATAIMLALPKVAKPVPPMAVPEAEPKNVLPWMEVALFGTVQELSAQLARGLDPNSKTAAGTTLLMMAARDPQKVKLLIERGADPKAKAKSGHTALMSATTYFGTSESVRLLLAKGAEARPGTGVMFNASPLFFAAFAGDLENAKLLKAAGGDIQRKMLLLGTFGNSPLFVAAAFTDEAMVRELIRAGADVKEQDQDQMTALHWAAAGNQPGIAKMLIDAGAKVDAVDKHGYTPLLYAATIYFGDTRVAGILRKAGADPRIRAKDGQSAVSRAGQLKTPGLKEALE